MKDSWERRRQRTRWWLARGCAGERLLELYLEILDLQQELGRETATADWTRNVLVGGNGTPAVDLGRLPVAVLVPRFQAFVRRLRPALTDVLASIASRLEAGEAGRWNELLAAFLAGRGAADLAARLEVEEVALEFFPRAFLQPIAEVLTAGGGHHDAGEASAGTCPVCGRLPQVAVLRDEAEVKGRRTLVCSFCAHEWPFRRATCPRCGEVDADKLPVHASPSLPHLRVEECVTCGTYLKGVDLRRDGHAVPIVEDLATVELDVWAIERGLVKIQPHLLGL